VAASGIRLGSLIAALAALAPAAAHAGWYKVGVVRADLAATHDGQPWDKPGEAQPQLKSCCHPGGPDGNGPDVQVVLKLGGQRFETRVRSDDLHPTWSDFAFLHRSGDEPLEIEVLDVDAHGADRIGRVTVGFDANGRLRELPHHFGAVESIQLYAEPVATPRLQTSIGEDANGVLDTHLVLLGGQAVRVGARGKMCMGKQCQPPEGKLTVFLGDDDHPVNEVYRLGLRSRAPASGFVKLWVPPPAEGALTGRYAVELTVEE
jgi:hypothetical protein